jgi:predicted amidohydrolase
MMRYTCSPLAAAVMGGLFAVSGCGLSRDAATTRPSARPARSLTVAAVSCESRPRDVEPNLSRIECWARRAAAAGADLALFPETAISGWWASREIRPYAEPFDGPSVQRLANLAKELGIVLAVGMSERAGDKVHITQAVIDGSGVIAYHRKTSLAPGEEKFWDPGNDANVFELKGVRIGIAICYASVQPPTCNKLRAGGAEVILAPYANGTDPDELLNGKRPYTYARAKENGVWYVACDATPHDEKKNLKRGAAYIISPQGELVAITPPDARDETMVVHTIRLDR